MKMKIRESFVSNSSTSSFVCDGEGKLVAGIIRKDLDKCDWKNLPDEEKESLVEKWAREIQHVDTGWSSDD